MARKSGEQHRLWKHGNGKYYLLWTEGGTTRRISTNTSSPKGAETFRAQYLANILNQAPAQITLAHILKKYAEEHGPKTRSQETINFHVKRLTKYFGKLTPDHVTNLVLADWAKKSGLGNGTILRHLNTLKAAVRYAAGNGWLKSVPVWKMPVSSPPPKDRWLTEEEVKKLLNASKAHHQKLFIMLALNTAARSSAILELKWDDVDLKRGIINYGKGHGNKRRAVVPINANLKKVLVEAKTAALTDYVIEFGGKPIKRAYRAFWRTCKNLGFVGVSPHTLRHTAATWMVIKGIPIEQVARFLGDSVATVERVYGKHSPSYLKKAANALQMNSVTM